MDIKNLITRNILLTGSDINKKSNDIVLWRKK